MAPDELNMERALELLETASIDEEPIGTDPETQKPVYLKQGRFGPYVQLGTKDDDEKPKNAMSLPWIDGARKPLARRPNRFTCRIWPQPAIKI